MSISAATSLLRLWDRGQRALAAGAYVVARKDLEAAELLAWRKQDARSLARIYLPLLEARRQIRYLAVEGVIVIGAAGGKGGGGRKRALTGFVEKDSGTILLEASGAKGLERVRQQARLVRQAARRHGRALESLFLIRRGDVSRLCAPGDPEFGAGLPIRWTSEAGEAIGASTEAGLVVPLPMPGRYEPSARAVNGPQMHALARESLIVAWEALALRWQHRHPPAKPGRRGTGRGGGG